MDKETEAAIAAALKEAKEHAENLSAKYDKANSAFHVFLREHPQAAFNSALFGGMIVWGGIGYLIGRF
mgnify:CR=1 FL=1